MQPSTFGERLAAIFDPISWSTWFASLDRGFLFLLLLPFVVAVVGLWASRDQEDAGVRTTDERDP
jgi:hypothetical protein